jgi:acetyltransferase-like isoleucine patch superfamily enzyme
VGQASQHTPTAHRQSTLARFRQIGVHPIVESLVQQGFSPFRLATRILATLASVWARFWMRYNGPGACGRMATRLATWSAPPYKGRCYLARLSPHGYTAPSAVAHHRDLRRGANVFIGEHVIIYRAHKNAGPVELGDRVHLHRDIIIEIGSGGSFSVGPDTHIQPRCQFSAYAAAIQIGRDVEIAPHCAFYPYDHGFAAGELIRKQPLQTRGDIVVGDDAWLGVGVIVLSGVRIGKGAVIGAGSVVTHNIPDGAIAAGVPARVVRMRTDHSRNGLAPSPKMGNMS